MNPDAGAMVYPLYGIGCHICGLPAQFYCDGITLPCKCGARTQADLERAIEQARHWREIARNQAARAKLAREAHAQALAERERWAAEAEARKMTRLWEELLDCLTSLAVTR